jgi:hypothetical protein
MLNLLLSLGSEVDQIAVHDRLALCFLSSLPGMTPRVI